MDTIKLEHIVPDANQPRKLFAVDKMARLKDSITRYGIMNPVKVEKMPNGNYKLLDGERRYRAAKELKLKEIPAIVSKSINDNDRLIRQFHIQQQNEDWTNTEKAAAISRLAEDTNMSVTELCEALSMPTRTISRFLNFGMLMDKEGFVRSELNVEWAEPLNSVNTTARLITQRELDKPYSQIEQREMERAIVSRIMSGEFRKPSEVAKLKDIFRTDPNSIQKFIDSPKTTTLEFFSKTGAKGAHHYRTAMNNARSFVVHSREFLKVKSIKIQSEHLRMLKDTVKYAQEMIDLAE